MTTISPSFFPLQVLQHHFADTVASTPTAVKKYSYRLGFLELPVLDTPVLSDMMPIPKTGNIFVITETPLVKVNNLVPLTEKDHE